MEYIWRDPHDLARLDYSYGGRRSSSSFISSSYSFSPQSARNWYRRLLLATAILGLAGHVLILAFFRVRPEGRFLSNLFQLILGFAGFLAMIEAGRRSRLAARWIWYYSAAAIGLYTAGQLVFMVSMRLGMVTPFSPRITDQFFFFWVAPLLAAGAIGSLGSQDAFDLTLLLDFTQLVILGVALHVFVFGDALRWRSHPQEMEFLKIKARIARDALVLIWLWARVWLARSQHLLRGLFARLGVFYLTYAIADAVYLYAEAVWRVAPGTWFDLLWSVPRATAVILALTWDWRQEGEARVVSGSGSRSWLNIAPVLVPLLMLAIGFGVFSSASILLAGLVVGSFAIASIRLMVMQSRQESTLTDLHNSNELLHSIIEGTSEAIYLKDREGRYKLINTAGARYLRRSPEEVLGRTDRELLSPETLEGILKIDEQVLSQGETITCEESLIENGKTRTFLTTKNPYRDERGRVTGVLGISVEISERRRMEEQIGRAQRMESIGAFSGAIAHDFNNVLTVIKGYSQITHSGLKDDPLLQGNLEQINKATDRAAALIRQLLAFSRQQVLQPRVISLNDIMSHMIKMLQRLMGEDIEIVTHLSRDLWAVKADPGQIEQVLMNLAANARDAMPRGGKLFLETANIHLDEAYARYNINVQPGDYAMFTVTDTGTGMDTQTQARIFEPFFSTKPTGQGTGLGLATAYGIVKQSGGYISVESETGAGAAFKVYLPRVDRPLEYHIEGPASMIQEDRSAL